MRTRTRRAPSRRGSARRPAWNRKNASPVRDSKQRAAGPARGSRLPGGPALHAGPDNLSDGAARRISHAQNTAGSVALLVGNPSADSRCNEPATPARHACRSESVLSRAARSAPRRMARHAHACRSESVLSGTVGPGRRPVAGLLAEGLGQTSATACRPTSCRSAGAATVPQRRSQHAGRSGSAVPGCRFAPRAPSCRSARWRASDTPAATS